MNGDRELTLQDVLGAIAGLQQELRVEIGEGRTEMRKALSGIHERVAELEKAINEVLPAGFGEVLAAVEKFEAKKADRTDVEALQTEVAELKRAAGE